MVINKKLEFYSNAFYTGTHSKENSTQIKKNSTKTNEHREKDQSYSTRVLPILAEIVYRFTKVLSGLGLSKDFSDPTSKKTDRTQKKILQAVNETTAAVSLEPLPSDQTEIASQKVIGPDSDLSDLVGPENITVKPLDSAFVHFLELHLPDDFEKLLEIPSVKARNSVMAAIINRDQVPLAKLSLTFKELCQLAPHLTYVDCRGIFENKKNFDVVDFLKECKQTTTLLMDLPELLEKNPSWRLLHLAVAREAQKLINNLIAAGIDVNQVDEKGLTPLHRAVMNGNVSVVQELFASKKVDLSIEDKIGWLPFHLAVRMSKDEKGVNGDIIQAFIEGGSDVNQVDEKKNAPLHIAVREGKVEAIRVLLASEKINLNIADKMGRPPFHLAAAMGKSDVVRAFIEAGADVNQVDEKKNAPLHIAVREGKVEAIRVLLASEKINLNIADKMGRPPFHLAAAMGKSDVVRAFIEAGADVNQVDGNGETPLHIAVREGKVEAIRALLASEKINLNIADKMGRPPFHLAAAMGKSDVVRAFIEAGADVNQVDKWGNTPLHKAVDLPGDEIIRILINAGADPDLINKNSITPKNLHARRSRDSEKIFGPRKVSDEISKLKFLSHSWGLSGTEKVGDHSIPLEGYFSGINAQFMVSKLIEFQNQDLFTITQTDHQEQISALEESINFSSERALETFKSGKPVIIHTGQVGHAINVVLYGSYLMICNKGLGTIKPIEVFKIDPSLVTSKMLQDISDLNKKPASSDVAEFDALFGERIKDQSVTYRKMGPLLMDLKAEASTGLSPWLENLTDDSRLQTVGNCTWESLQTALKVVMAIQTAKKYRLEERIIGGETDGKIENEEAYENFMLRKQFFQFTALEEYLGVVEMKLHDSSPEIREQYNATASKVVAMAKTLSKTSRVRKSVNSINDKLMHITYLRVKPGYYSTAWHIYYSLFGTERV